MHKTYFFFLLFYFHPLLSAVNHSPKKKTGTNNSQAIEMKKTKKKTNTLEALKNAAKIERMKEEEENARKAARNATAIQKRCKDCTISFCRLEGPCALHQN